MGCVFLRGAMIASLENETDPELAPIAATLRQRRARFLLLASTNRGFRPTGWLSLGLAAVHRWFWVTLFAVVWGAWIRAWPAPEARSIAAWSTTALTAFVLAAFAWERCFTWRGLLWASMAVVWAHWGATGATGARPLLWAAMALTPTGTLALSTLLGFGRGHAILHTVLATAAALVSSRADPSVVWLWPTTLGLVLSFILYPWTSGLLFENFLYGSPWIARVRLKWLEWFRSGKVPEPIVCHAFGECDRLVDEDDQIELTAPSDSAEYALRDGTHLDFTLTPRRSMRGRGEATSVAARHAAIGEFLEFAVRGLPPAPSEATGWRRVDAPAQRTATPVGASPDPSKHVVILIHGIRDFGEWQDTLADRVRELAARTGSALAEIVVVRYGYFTAFQFLISGERDRATRSFLDAYTQARARHPDAKIHVAAHSNGTYVVCNALRKDASVELENVFFAGSVVSPSYPWSSVSGPTPTQRGGRINGRVRSDCATKDWPVGVLCWILSGFGLLNRFAASLPWGRLGAGGVDGFKYPDLATGRKVTETRHLVGGHGEAIRGPYHDGIAQFLLTGDPGQLSGQGNVSWGFRIGVTAVVLAAVVVVGWLYQLTIAWAPGGSATWSVLVGSLLTLVVVRIAMAV